MTLHLHPSALGTLSNCGIQAYLRYVEGIRRPPSVAGVVGKATHRSVEDNLRHKRAKGEQLELDRLIDEAADAFEDEWGAEGAPELHDSELDLGLPRVRGQAKDMALNLAHLHWSRIAPGVVPQAVEYRIHLAVSGAPFELTGYVDVIDEGGDGRGRVARDTKTIGKRPADDSAERDVQLAFYAFALERITETADQDVRVDRVAKDFLVKTKQPYELQQVVPAPSDHGPLLRRIESAARVFETGSFMPANPDWWGCSERWCGYARDRGDGRPCEFGPLGGRPKVI